MIAQRAPELVKVVLWDGLFTEVDPPRRTRWRYVVDAVDDDGVALGVWDGGSYRDALAAAEEWRRHGLRVEDRVKRRDAPFSLVDGGGA